MLAIATNIPVLLKTGFVLQGHICVCFCFFPQMDVFDAAEKYQQAGHPLLILAGKEYGSGSSRDWAAKGPFLLVRLHYTSSSNNVKLKI